MADPSITDEQIRALQVEALHAGDYAQASLCRAALNGDEMARAKCERVIGDAAAQRLTDKIGEVSDV